MEFPLTQARHRIHQDESSCTCRQWHRWQVPCSYFLIVDTPLLYSLRSSSATTSCTLLECRYRGDASFLSFGCRNLLRVSCGTSSSLVIRSCRSEERRVGKECRSRWSAYH